MLRSLFNGYSPYFIKKATNKTTVSVIRSSYWRQRNSHRYYEADRVNEIFDNVKESSEGNSDLGFPQILITQFCLEIGMSPKNMSPQEIETLKAIIVRSKKYKQTINQMKNKKMKKKR